MFINYHYSKTLIFRNRPYKEEEQEVELNFEKKSRFKCYPFVILLLIYATFHCLNSEYFYNDDTVI